MYNRCNIFSVRSTNVHYEIWFLDVQRRPGVVSIVQQQELR
nr:unnamed protein product [Callosobruchus analis]